MKTQNKKLLVLTLILSTFLNVGVASAQSFAGLAKELKQDLTLISFDWRGHGQSEKPDEGDFS